MPGLISAIVALAYLPIGTIHSRFGNLPNTLPLPKLPSITRAKLTELFPSALTIAFLAALKSLLSAMVADKMIDGHHRPNTEVTAQGFANIASSLFGGVPVTGATRPRRKIGARPSAKPFSAAFTSAMFRP